MDTGSVEKRLLASPYVKFKKGRPDLRKIMREEMDRTRMDGKMSVNGTSLFLQVPCHGLLMIMCSLWDGSAIQRGKGYPFEAEVCGDYEGWTGRVVAC
jgi:hypothetical protein